MQIAKMKQQFRTYLSHEGERGGKGLFLLETQQLIHEGGNRWAGD